MKIKLTDGSGRWFNTDYVMGEFREPDGHEIVYVTPSQNYIVWYYDHGVTEEPVVHEVDVEEAASKIVRYGLDLEDTVIVGELAAAICDAEKEFEQTNEKNWPEDKEV